MRRVGPAAGDRVRALRPATLRAREETPQGIWASTQRGCYKIPEADFGASSTDEVSRARDTSLDRDVAIMVLTGRTPGLIGSRVDSERRPSRAVPSTHRHAENSISPEPQNGV